MEFTSLSDLISNIKSKRVSCVEVTKHYLQQVSKKDAQLKSFININESAIDLARAVDEKINKGEVTGALAGLPIGVKDMFCTEGLITTAGSKILENFIPPYTATVVKKLQKAGAIVLGKCNQDEFAMGSSNETSYFGACKNPWSLDRVPGGSSGGSAAAVAGGLCPASIGTDTGGSIRQPASFCNLVGVKPTYGRISRYGVVAFASSLDQAGPVTKRVSDASLMLEVMCGQDKNDSTSSRNSVPSFYKELCGDIKGKRVGVIKEIEDFDINTEMKTTYDELVKALTSAGANVVEVSLPLLKYSVETYYVIATSEASSNLSRYDGVRYGYRANFTDKPAEGLEDFYSRTRGEGFGSEVKRRIILGTFALSSGYYDAYFQKAARVRRMIHDEFVAAFSSCDAMISPVAVAAAFKLGEMKDPLSLYYNDVFTTGASLAGLPAMSVPLGFTKDNLPFGLQIISNHFNEQEMLNVGQFVEDLYELYKRVPNV